MRARDFAYWLQGYFEILDADKSVKELSDRRELDVDQVKCIKKHLALVFKHEIDPSAGSSAHQAELDEIHVGDIHTEGASTLDPPLPPAMLKKFEDMRKELDEKMKELRASWVRPPSSPFGPTMRC